jgi:glycosidase
MDEEGFSGKDGRTTIFDYWSLDTLCREAKGCLNEHELLLQRSYQCLMAIAQKEPAIAEGKMFDLCYVNRHQPRVFSFLRKSDKQTLLVIANFSDKEQETHVIVPQAAFDYLDLKAGAYKAADLMSPDSNVEAKTLIMEPDKAVSITVGEWGVKVLALRG